MRVRGNVELADRRRTRRTCRRPGGRPRRDCTAAGPVDDALDVVQRASQTSAATAVNKLAVRLSAGSDRLAKLVRNDQDLGDLEAMARFPPIANE